jgi:hypothetical protein
MLYLRTWRNQIRKIIMRDQILLIIEEKWHQEEEEEKENGNRKMQTETGEEADKDIIKDREKMKA